MYFDSNPNRNCYGRFVVLTMAERRRRRLSLTGTLRLSRFAFRLAQGKMRKVETKVLVRAA